MDVITLISSFQDLTNEDAASVWSWWAREWISIPAAANFANTSSQFPPSARMIVVDIPVVGECLQRALGHRVHRERGRQRFME